MPSLLAPLTLPSGAVLPARLVEAAMEESMAVGGRLPGDRLIRLHPRWGQGGAGLLITGNVMVHAQAFTGSADVVLDSEPT